MFNFNNKDTVLGFLLFTLNIFHTLNRPLRLPSFDSNWIQNSVTEFQKLKPKIIAYPDYKNFDNAKFRYDIVTATSNVDNFGMYKSTIFNIF